MCQKSMLLYCMMAEGNFHVPVHCKNTEPSYSKTETTANSRDVTTVYPPRLHFRTATNNMYVPH